MPTLFRPRCGLFDGRGESSIGWLSSKHLTSPKTPEICHEAAGPKSPPQATGHRGALATVARQRHNFHIRLIEANIVELALHRGEGATGPSGALANS
ncbi:MAG: hypothetical protein HDR87_10305 [Bacteroides sp.]|nr:hypothetical protein [Bacteroides sp.]